MAEQHVHKPKAKYRETLTIDKTDGTKHTDQPREKAEQKMNLTF